MTFPISEAARSRLLRLGRIVLGVLVGASFGVAVGALVASWVWGVEAIESEAVNASYLAGAITLFGGAVGGLIASRVGRGAEITDSDQAAPRR